MAFLFYSVITILLIALVVYRGYLKETYRNYGTEILTKTSYLSSDNNQSFKDVFSFGRKKRKGQIKRKEERIKYQPLEPEEDVQEEVSVSTQVPTTPTATPPLTPLPSPTTPALPTSPTPTPPPLPTAPPPLPTAPSPPLTASPLPTLGTECNDTCTRCYRPIGDLDVIGWKVNNDTDQLVKLAWIDRSGKPTTRVVTEPMMIIPANTTKTLPVKTGSLQAWVVFDKDNKCLGPIFPNKKQTKVSEYRDTGIKAILFTEKDYKGSGVRVGVGRYNMWDIPEIENDRLSSLLVPLGLKVTLYLGAFFGGKKKVITSDTPELDKQFDDQVSSIVIEKI